MEDGRLGRRAATRHWSHHLSPACFATSLTLAERCGAGTAQRIEERLGIFVWTACGKSRRSRLGRLHSRFSGASGSDLLCGLHRNALSPTRVTNLRATLCETLSSHD